MSNRDEFNPWQWDREMARSGQARLTIERHGHEVALDHQGVSIDGRRIVRDDPSQGDHGFRITPLGTVVYRDQEIAEIDAPPEGTANPGEVTVWGKNGPTLPERRQREKDARQQQEEAQRRERDERYRSTEQQHQHELTHTHGQEMTR
ncbi:hypothetical protein [Streptomyces sp. BRA346]|uniref:hypothetical protein n=1 Tax=Streptomyces sp. BRA346 TaxID=2878199 RepID=UPI004062C382